MIAKRLGVSASTIYVWWRDHGLPGFKVAGETSPLCAYPEDLDAWIDAKRNAPLTDGEG